MNKYRRMMGLSEKIKNVDLVTLATDAGVELRQRGNAHIGKCPLHSDENPSFYIYRRNRWHCYAGCGGGDAADLVQRIYQCDFPEALRRLGINGEPLTLEEKIKIRQRKRRKALRVQRERDLLHTLSFLIRATRKCMDGMTPEGFDQYGEIMHELPLWEFYHSVLSSGTREEKDELIINLRGMTTIRRRYLFRLDFNFRQWLFNINHNSKGVNNNSKGAGTNGKKRIRRN